MSFGISSASSFAFFLAGVNTYLSLTETRILFAFLNRIRDGGAEVQQNGALDFNTLLLTA